MIGHMFFIITDCNMDQCAASSLLYHQRQKITFCLCPKQTFHYSLLKIEKQINCCEMFICCREMPYKILSITQGISTKTKLPKLILTLRPHLLYQGLLFLPAHHPNRQNHLHAKQHKEEHPHLQKRKLIWDNCAGKGFFTYFRTNCH